MCEYLGVEVSEGRLFPRLSDCEEFPRMMRRRMTAALAPEVGKVVAAASALLAAL